MKKIILLLLTTSLMGCGSDSDDSPTVGIEPETPDDSVLIAECENSGCTLEEAVSTPTLIVTTAPITLAENASITLE